MSLSGLFKTMPAADLLQWLSMARKSGSLQVRNSHGEIRFFFDQGRVVCSSSNDPSWLLGALLVREGYITAAQQEDALARQRQKTGSLGKILLDLGAISQTQLLNAVQLNVEHQIRETLLSQDSSFTFDENDSIPADLLPLAADVVPILLHTLRGVDEDACDLDQELLF